jgi:hypothetical protein
VLPTRAAASISEGGWMEVADAPEGVLWRRKGFDMAGSHYGRAIRLANR